MRNGKWRTYRIGDLGRIVTGKTPSSSRPECFGNEYPFVTPTDMHARRYAASTERYLSEEGANVQRSLLVPPGSVCVSCIGWQMGKAIVTAHSSFTNQQLHTIIPSSDIDALFLYYSLCTRREELLSLGSAAGVRTPIINNSAFCNLTVLLPENCLQRKIAGVLSAYDDLIENNTRRIAISEEMAQAIYREWFVNFRFPGHGKVDLINSPLGKIPEGWKMHLGDVVTLKRGYDLPQRDRRLGNVPLVSSSGITDFHDEAMAKGPGVVTGRYGTLGQVFYIREDFWPLNTTLYVQDFHDNEPLLVVHLLRSLNLASQNAAGAVPGVNRNALHMLDVSFPPTDIQKLISPVFEAIEDNCYNLRSKNVTLKATRDLLLPKLISGQLDVEELDIDAGEPLAEVEI